MGSKYREGRQVRLRANRCGTGARNGRKASGERREGESCASCNAPCRPDRFNMVVTGERLAKYRRTANPTNFPFPFDGDGEDVVLCKSCVTSWKVLLDPNSVEKRVKQQNFAIESIQRRKERNELTETKLFNDVICSVCKAVGSKSKSKAVWRPHLISKVPSLHKNKFVTTLAGKLKVTRRCAVDLVNNYKERFVCSWHSSVIYKVKQRYCWADLRCSIPKCKSLQCRPLRVQEEKRSEEYIAMEDSLASIMMLIDLGRPEGRGMCDEDVNLDEFSNKPVCSSHLWQLTRGKGNGKTGLESRPASRVGIASLIGSAERDTAAWLRRQIFARTSSVCGNVVFCKDVYNFYVQLCERSGKKAKTERYIITRLAEVLAVFKVFVKTGKELGRGHAFFYNENRLVISVGMSEYARLANEKYTVSSMQEEDDVLRQMASRYRANRSRYETGVIDLKTEIMSIDTRLFTSVALSMCSPRFLRMHKGKCRKRMKMPPEREWPICNICIPEPGDMDDGDLKRAIRVMIRIEQSVRNRYADSHGPLSLLLGMASLVESSTKLHYVMNRLGVTPSYEAVDVVRKKLMAKAEISENGTLAELPQHDMAVFAIDNLDQSNNHGITVKGRTKHGLHITAIQAVLCNVNAPVHRPIIIRDDDRNRHTKLVDANKFITQLVPVADDPDINAYVAMFIGAVYRYQHRIATDDTNEAMSVTRLLMSLFEGYRNKCDVKYVDVIDDNAARKTAIQKSISRIYDIYGKKKRMDGHMTVFVGDQPTFKSLFWMYYDGLEYGENDIHEWGVPITAGFHDEKRAVLETLKWSLHGTGMEEFLRDSGLSESQCENFMKYGHARRNRRFILQYAAAVVIKLCDSIMLEDEAIGEELRHMEDIPHKNHPASLPEDCQLIVSSGGGGGSEVVYQIGKLFQKRFQELVETKNHRNVRYHVGTVLLRLMIPATGYYILGRLGQAKVVDKFLFNTLPVMMRTTKLAYCELMVCYGFIRAVMPSQMFDRLYEDEAGALMVGSKEPSNKMSSLFHDEALEMGIIRHLKSLGYSTYDELRNAVSWVQAFGTASDTLADSVGGRVGTVLRSRHEEFGDGGMRMGYDRTRLQAINVKAMIQRMHRTRHFGPEFLKAEHICSYATGEVIEMNDESLEEKLITMPEDGLELAKLFAKALFPRRFVG